MPYYYQYNKHFTITSILQALETYITIQLELELEKADAIFMFHETEWCWFVLFVVE